MIQGRLSRKKFGELGDGACPVSSNVVSHVPMALDEQRVHCQHRVWAHEMIIYERPGRGNDSLPSHPEWSVFQPQPHVKREQNTNVELYYLYQCCSSH